MYTLNCIDEYRHNVRSGGHVVTSTGSRRVRMRSAMMNKHGDVELATVRAKSDRVYVQTEVITDVSGTINENDERPREDDVEISGWQQKWAQ
ncbi:hypothetical protein B0H13DRAFT_2326704 [Mycena leptocephala]|nr:hypothetical protein B0H13DRAFT_2326704 [Mycena leptocephala]